MQYFSEEWENDTRYKQLEAVYESSPGILDSSMGLLVGDLQNETVCVRVAAVESIGRMVNEFFCSTWPDVFKEWRGRGLDKSVAVRIAVVNSCFSGRHEVLWEIAAGRFSDVDERVRCAVFNAWTAPGTPQFFFEAACARVKDKKVCFVSLDVCA